MGEKYSNYYVEFIGPGKKKSWKMYHALWILAFLISTEFFLAPFIVTACNSPWNLIAVLFAITKGFIQMNILKRF